MYLSYMTPEKIVFFSGRGRALETEGAWLLSLGSPATFPKSFMSLFSTSVLHIICGVGLVRYWEA